MNYFNKIVIELPMDQVIELFDNPDNLKKSQKYMQYFKKFAKEKVEGI